VAVGKCPVFNAKKMRAHSASCVDKPEAPLTPAALP
jgi:hypothetical protein